MVSMSSQYLLQQGRTNVSGRSPVSFTAEPASHVVVDDVERLEPHCPRSLATDGVEGAVSRPDWQDFFEHQRQQPAASRTEQHIVQEKGVLEVRRWDHWLLLALLCINASLCAICVAVLAPLASSSPSLDALQEGPEGKDGGEVEGNGPCCSVPVAEGGHIRLPPQQSGGNVWGERRKERRCCVVQW